MMVDKEAAVYGMEDLQAARFDPDRGVYQIADPKNPKAGKDGYIDAPEKFIPWDPTAARSAVDTLGDKDYGALSKASAEIVDKDMATDATIGAINTSVEALNRGNEPLTVVSGMANVANNVAANITQLTSIDGSLGGVFATEAQAKEGTGGSLDRVGTGQYSKQLMLALESGDKDAIKGALEMWEAEYSGQYLPDGRSMSMKSFLGDISYDKIDASSAMLQVGYLLASANGQTGRTLSDKDLMFHLQMIGFGATQDSKLATKLLLRVGNDLINRNDRNAQLKMSPISMTGYGASLENPRYQAIIGRLWNPATEKSGEDVIELWSKPEQYTFRNYGERTKFIRDLDGSNPFEIFQGYVLAYHPELKTRGATGREYRAIKGGRSPAMENTDGLYD